MREPSAPAEQQRQNQTRRDEKPHIARQSGRRLQRAFRAGRHLGQPHPQPVVRRQRSRVTISRHVPGLSERGRQHLPRQLPQREVEPRLIDKRRLDAALLQTLGQRTAACLNGARLLRGYVLSVLTGEQRDAGEHVPERPIDGCVEVLPRPRQLRLRRRQPDARNPAGGQHLAQIPEELPRVEATQSRRRGVRRENQHDVIQPLLTRDRRLLPSMGAPVDVEDVRRLIHPPGHVFPRQANEFAVQLNVVQYRGPVLQHLPDASPKPPANHQHARRARVHQHRRVDRGLICRSILSREDRQTRRIEHDVPNIHHRHIAVPGVGFSHYVHSAPPTTEPRPIESGRAHRKQQQHQNDRCAHAPAYDGSQCAEPPAPPCPHRNSRVHPRREERRVGGAEVVRQPEVEQEARDHGPARLEGVDLGDVIVRAVPLSYAAQRRERCPQQHARQRQRGRCQKRHRPWPDHLPRELADAPRCLRDPHRRDQHKRRPELQPRGRRLRSPSVAQHATSRRATDGHQGQPHQQDDRDGYLVAEERGEQLARHHDLNQQRGEPKQEGRDGPRPRQGWLGS